jgi:hypothetical protein
MENPRFSKQHDRHSTALALADVCTQLAEQSFDLAPGDAGLDRVGEDGFEGAVVLAPHP